MSPSLTTHLIELVGIDTFMPTVYPPPTRVGARFLCVAIGIGRGNSRAMISVPCCPPIPVPLPTVILQSLITGQLQPLLMGKKAALLQAPEATCGAPPLTRACCSLMPVRITAERPPDRQTCWASAHPPLARRPSEIPCSTALSNPPPQIMYPPVYYLVASNV